jgi:hypothetical protein
MFKSSKVTLPILSTLVSSLLVAACGAAPESGGSSDVAIGQTSDALRAPTLPSPTLAVPAGNKLRFFYDAVGVQIYACSATTTGFGWAFKAPEATLYDKHGRIAGKHYAGPTWESTDGSTVVGLKIAAFTADPTAIPELLLQAVAHTGDGRMSDVTFVQRLDTTGGLAPTTGCDASHVGDLARIDYTATYFFYEAEDDDETDGD